MFYHIIGEIVLTEVNTAVIECNGIGYKLTVSGNTIARLSTHKDKVKLYTHLHVREDALELFGFYELEELSAFKMLNSVSGVGPKAALSILTLLSPAKFALAVTSGDTQTLSKASGIGAKTAARIVLELKDKVAKQLCINDSSPSTDELSTGKYSNKLNEAQNALLVLGYSRSEATSALKSVDTSNLDIEDIIRVALKKLMR